MRKEEERKRREEEQKRKEEEERKRREEQAMKVRNRTPLDDIQARNLDILEADDTSDLSPDTRLSYTSQQLLNIRNYIQAINKQYDEYETLQEVDEDDDLVHDFVSSYF